MIHYYLSLFLKLTIFYHSSFYYFDAIHNSTISDKGVIDVKYVYELAKQNLLVQRRELSNSDKLFHTMVLPASVCQALNLYLNSKFNSLFTLCQSLPVTKKPLASEEKLIKEKLQYVSPIINKEYKSSNSQSKLKMPSNLSAQKQKDTLFSYESIDHSNFSFNKKLKATVNDFPNVRQGYPSAQLGSFKNILSSECQKKCFSNWLAFVSSGIKEDTQNLNPDNDFVTNRNRYLRHQNGNQFSENVMHVLQSYLYFTFHDEIIQNGACDIEVLSTCWSLNYCIPGLCTFCSWPENFNKEKLKDYAKQITAFGNFTIPGETVSSVTRFAYGLALLNFGHLNKSVEHFKRLTKSHPHVAFSHIGFAVSLFRINPKENGDAALRNLNMALKAQGDHSDVYLKRAEIHYFMTDYTQAYNDLSNAMSVGRKTWPVLILRALTSIAMSDWMRADNDLRSCLQLVPDDPHVLMLLGHCTLQQGSLRKALELFRESGTYNTGAIDAFLRAADVLRHLAETDKTVDLLTGLLLEKLSPFQEYSVQRMLAFSFSTVGRVVPALRHSSLCLSLRPDCPDCLMVDSISRAHAGQFYAAVKSATKLITSRSATLSDLVEAVYLREWSRYLHQHLDKTFLELNFTDTWSSDFLYNYITNQPLSENYIEQPGLQPDKPDVVTPDFSSLTYPQQKLICVAHQLTSVFSSDADAVTNHERVHLSLALGSLHTAQLLLNRSQPITWLALTDLLSRYVQLADLTTPALLLYSLPKSVLDEDGLITEYRVVKDDIPNPALSAYHRLVFQLVKTMTEHIRGPSERDDLKRKFEQADSLHKVLLAAKERKTFRDNDLGLIASTQVPSTVYRDQMRHEGAYLALTESPTGSASLSVRVRVRSQRLNSYKDELEILFSRLVNDLRSDTKSTDLTTFISRSLNLLYYSTNAMPVGPKRSAGVGLSLSLGILLASGITARGRLPPGKILELEPVLAGTPDAFVLVTHQWLKPSVLTNQNAMKELAPIDKAFSTVRSVLEFLSVQPSESACSQLEI